MIWDVEMQELPKRVPWRADSDTENFTWGKKGRSWDCCKLRRLLLRHPILSYKRKSLRLFSWTLLAIWCNACGSLLTSQCIVARLDVYVITCCGVGVLCNSCLIVVVSNVLSNLCLISSARLSLGRSVGSNILNYEPMIISKLCKQKQFAFCVSHVTTIRIGIILLLRGCVTSSLCVCPFQNALWNSSIETKLAVLLL